MKRLMAFAVFAAILFAGTSLAQNQKPVPVQQNKPATLSAKQEKPVAAPDEKTLPDKMQADIALAQRMILQLKFEENDLINREHQAQQNLNEAMQAARGYLGPGWDVDPDTLKPVRVQAPKPAGQKKDK